MSQRQPELLIATRNPGKVREFQELFRDLPYRLLSLDEVGVTGEVEETGQSFRENAWLKASEYSKLSGLLTLSDDSGLEVDALGGEPGIHSARYGGDASFSDQDRVSLLLKKLKDVPWERRTARFLCVIALARGTGMQGNTSAQSEDAQRDDSPEIISSVVGSIAGMIQYAPAGEEGFGYDPVFYLPSYGLTMAQLPMQTKNVISHRSDAAGKTAQVLRRLAAEG